MRRLTLTACRVALVLAAALSAWAADPEPFDAAGVARQLLDATRPAAERNALIAKYPGKAAELIRAMTADLGSDAKEEYRRIPPVWQVAVAAGKRNQPSEVRATLDAALPKAGTPLRDWQAVVVGGGVINGIGLTGVWPGPAVRGAIGADAALAARWDAALAAAVAMADRDAVPKGTRYDALRMVALLGWDKARDQLGRYLAKGTHAELQMGAVSGLVDVDDPAATAALVSALGHLTGENRRLALLGLTRGSARCVALLDAVERGTVKADALGPDATKTLRGAADDAVRARAEKLLPKP